MAIAPFIVSDGQNIQQSTPHDEELKSLISLDNNWWVTMSDILGRGVEGKSVSDEGPFQNNFVDGDRASEIKRSLLDDDVNSNVSESERHPFGNIYIYIY